MAQKEGLLLWSMGSGNRLGRLHLPTTAFLGDVTGIPSILLLINFLAVNSRRLGERSAEVWMTSINVSNTADALNALSINQVTGHIYLSNQRIFEFLPAQEHCVVTCQSSKTMLSLGVNSDAFNAAAMPIETPSVFGSSVGMDSSRLIYSINPTRASINAATTQAAYVLLFGILAKS